MKSSGIGSLFIYLSQPRTDHWVHVPFLDNDISQLLSALSAPSPGTDFAKHRRRVVLSPK